MSTAFLSTSPAVERIETVSSRNQYVLIGAIVLAVLAGGLRFYGLGQWPFYGDELATFDESDALFHGNIKPGASDQIHRLPRMIPLGYVIHYTSYQLFGRDEFGSRALLALLGTAQVLVVFFGLARPLGRPAAVAAALLVAVGPDFIYQSQHHRFYLAAGFFASLAMVAGAQALHRRSAWWMILSSIAVFAAVLCHTLQGILFSGLLAGIGLAAWFNGRQLPWKLVSVIGVAMILAVALVAFYLMPIARGWNTGEGWGMKPGGAVLGSLYLMGWPIDLLAVVGALLMWQRRPEQGVYWITLALVWLAASALMPAFIVYHYSYAFPLSLAAVALAGFAVGEIYELLRSRSAAVAWTWVAAVCAFHVPSLLSHYRDGSRYDYRSAAQYIAAHWQPGDRVAAVSGAPLAWYEPVCNPTIWLPPADPLPRIKQLSAEPERLWIVVPCDRTGLGPTVGRWLNAHCSHELDVRRKRFDYRDYAVEVFLHPATEGGTQTSSAR